MRVLPRDLREWRTAAFRIIAMLLAAAGVLVLAAFMLSTMPGSSSRGPPPPLDAAGQQREARLRADVKQLATTIGERNERVPAGLERAAQWLEAVFARAGWQVSAIEVPGGPRVRLPGAASATDDASPMGGTRNIIAERRGTTRPDEIVLVGAHYDSVERSSGADDNASGVAVLLEIARAFGDRTFERTVRLVAFVNEEPPYFHGSRMGSRVAAATFHARGEHFAQVLVLDAVGYYCGEDCQWYPPLLKYVLPDTGDFIAFATQTGDWWRLRDVVGRFRRHARIASEGLAAPAWVPGIDFSDHAEFWRVGEPGILISDAPVYRNVNYHKSTDSAETLDYLRLTWLATALIEAIAELAADDGG